MILYKCDYSIILILATTSTPKETHNNMQHPQQTANLKTTRENRHLTQQQVAARMGINQNRVSAIELRGIGHINIKTLERYANALGGKLHITLEFNDGRQTTITE